MYSDDVPAGGVAETSPAVGQEVRTGTAVSVSLSKGPAPVAVPDVKGLSRSAAESALKSAGLKVARVDEGFISTTPKDHVFGILPAPGTEVTRGTEVVIQVSTALEVPDIVGMSQEEGTKASKSTRSSRTTPPAPKLIRLWEQPQVLEPS